MYIFNNDLDYIDITTEFEAINDDKYILYEKKIIKWKNIIFYYLDLKTDTTESINIFSIPDKYLPSTPNYYSSLNIWGYTDNTSGYAIIGRVGKVIQIKSNITAYRVVTNGIYMIDL